MAARQTSEQQLAEAKVEAAELGTELAALKQELKKVRGVCREKALKSVLPLRAPSHLVSLIEMWFAQEGACFLQCCAALMHSAFMPL